MIYGKIFDMHTYPIRALAVISNCTSMKLINKRKAYSDVIGLI